MKFSSFAYCTWEEDLYAVVLIPTIVIISSTNTIFEISIEWLCFQIGVKLMRNTHDVLEHDVLQNDVSEN
jgi:hypothetical protein